MKPLILGREVVYSGYLTVERMGAGGPRSNDRREAHDSGADITYTETGTLPACPSKSSA